MPVIENLSVILQVASFQLTGKRIFKMSPLHHHFELSGWKETAVVYAFWLAAAVFAFLGLLFNGIRLVRGCDVAQAGETAIRRKQPDFILLFAVLTLLAIGIVMVFSASMVRSVRFYGHPYYFLVRQLMWAGLGLSAMFFLANYDCWRYRKFITGIYALSLLLLVLVLIPGIGQVRNDARRWIGVGSMVIQPSEIAKFTTVLFLADSLAKRREKVGDLIRGLGPYLVLLGVTFVLVLAEPDLGTAVAIAAARSWSFSPAARKCGTLSAWRYGVARFVLGYHGRGVQAEQILGLPSSLG